MSSHRRGGGERAGRAKAEVRSRSGRRWAKAEEEGPAQRATAPAAAGATPGGAGDPLRVSYALIVLTVVLGMWWRRRGQSTAAREGAASAPEQAG